jgi:hypothetical protein
LKALDEFPTVAIRKCEFATLLLPFVFSALLFGDLKGHVNARGGTFLHRGQNTAVEVQGYTGSAVSEPIAGDLRMDTDRQTRCPRITGRGTARIGAADPVTVAGPTRSPFRPSYLRGFALMSEHKWPISDRTRAPTMIGSQIDMVMTKKETTITRPTTDSLTGYLRRAKFA